ncbi:hypothetical protein AMJ87_05645 [candidate division WOR_3 bacterium SM23_60]|uniref:Uncharacterized protein n=1 Tax=candidate division WOR_3 bacterium SM23_60 TaxID=1703780 RepID=A0A0S8GGN5_UNCW3|nr:MAG: hypothetical protein AMJ87_05645 [candidate division WOR_3 bacterium SM23_60]
MKRLNWQVLLGISLVVLSAFVYFIHYLVFRDVHHIFIYLVGDIAFVFIEVLLVTLIIHRLLGEREKRSMLEKMNMVIGTFFSEVGTYLLREFSRFDPQCDGLRKHLRTTKDFSQREFAAVSRKVKVYDCIIESSREDLQALKTFLVGKREFLLRLLANPNLLEHDTFTNLLWAVFHLTDELDHRKDISAIPDKDYAHLAGDVKRAYVLLISEWLDYMKHLKTNYPYLFSLAMRTNPFDLAAQPEIT